MVWQDGDWVLDGNYTKSQPRHVESLAGYVEWGPK